MESISIGKAKSQFSELISRAASGERLLIQRRERPVAVLISPAELERLERASQLANQLALALGQRREILQQVEQGELHPAMLAFGLWQDEADLESLEDEIYRNRQDQGSRVEADL